MRLGPPRPGQASGRSPSFEQAKALHPSQNGMLTSLEHTATSGMSLAQGIRMWVGWPTVAWASSSQLRSGGLVGDEYLRYLMPQLPAIIFRYPEMGAAEFVGQT